MRRPNGGFAFTGDGGGGTYVLATDRNGDADWVHRFQGEAVVATDPYLGPASSRSNGIALHGDGGFVVSGSQPAPMDSPLEDDAEVGWLAAIDDDRELAWHADPVTETASTCRDVVRRGDGSFAFVETQAGDEGPRGWVGVVDGDGDLQTEETYDIEPMDADELPDGDDELVQGFGSLTTTSDEGLVLAGGTAGGGWLVKTDAEGAAAWHSRLEPPHGGLWTWRRHLTATT